MSLSSCDSFDFEIESLVADCNDHHEEVSSIKRNKEITGQALIVEEDDEDIFDMAEVNWSDSDDDDNNANEHKQSNKSQNIHRLNENIDKQVKEKLNRHVENDKSEITGNEFSANPRRKHLDSGIESMDSEMAMNEMNSSDSDGKQNSDSDNDKIPLQSKSDPHAENTAEMSRHLSWLEEEGERIEVLPLPKLPQKWKPAFKRNDSEDEVRNLLSFWSDKTCLHGPIKRTASAPGGSLKAHWLEAMAKAKTHGDPWKKHNIIDTCTTERAKRYRYNALKKKWVVDFVYVKMQEESFGHGAMRKCFRMKKLSTRVHQDDWSYAGNVVSKRYIEDVMPKVYFDDVKLQMDAKLWAEEYNRHDPPKKIDIIQVACISLIDRDGSPMYHVEHFVEGKYVKYNSNSGFVLREEEHIRATPQAFSHFTFERSGHQMIVVDVQGVGDLYTDPQIHTAKLDEYGDANLGSKGMALFFATHECTEICRDLNLEIFDLSLLEMLRIQDAGSRSGTTTEVKHHHSNGGLAPLSPGAKLLPMFELVERLQSDSSDDAFESHLSDTSSSNMSSVYSSSNEVSAASSTSHDFYAEIHSGMSSVGEGTQVHFFNQMERKGACVSDNGQVQLSSECIEQRLKDLKNFEEMQISILGNIHFDLAVYNNIGRFTDGIPDDASTLFHLNKATLCGSLDANKIMAMKYFNLPTDQFPELQVPEDHDRGMDCLIEAATRGDKESIMKTAKSFDTGINLGKARQISWTEAVKWYEAGLNMQFAGTETYPAHEIYARMADMWREGGNGIEKDPSYAGELYSNAADAAMAAGKGKMANKYFMYAEEAWGEVEE